MLGKSQLYKSFFPSFLAVLNTYTIIKHATLCTVRSFTKERHSIRKYIFFTIVIFLGYSIYHLALFAFFLAYTFFVLCAVRYFIKEKQLTPITERYILFAIIVFLASSLYSVAMIGFVAFAFSVPY